MKKFTALIPVIILLFFPAAILADQLKSNYIEWKKVEGVRYYRIEIIDHKSAVVLDRIVPDNRLNFETAVGNYRFRIGILDDKKNLQKWSDWKKLTIEPLARPEIKSEAAAFALDKTTEKAEIAVSGVSSLTRAYLVKDDKIIPVTIDTLPNGNAEVEIQTQGLEKGDYQLVLKNPNFPSSNIPVKLVENQEIKERVMKEAGIGDAAAMAKRNIKIDEEKITKISNAYWKLMVPGLIQKEKKRNLSSSLFIASIGAGGAIVVTSYQRYKAWYAFYNYSSNKLSEFYLEKAANPVPLTQLETYSLILRYNSLHQAKRGINNSINGYYIGGAIAGSVYISQAIEGYFNHSEQTEQPVVSRRKALLQSAVMPGWGQLSSSRYMAGVNYMTTFITVAALAAGTQSEYYAWKKYYNAATEDTRYLLLNQASLTQNTLNFSYYKNRETVSYVRANMHRASAGYSSAMGAMALVYLVNLADVYFFYGKDRKMAVILRPQSDGLGIFLVKRF